MRIQGKSWTLEGKEKKWDFIIPKISILSTPMLAHNINLIVEKEKLVKHEVYINDTGELLSWPPKRPDNMPKVK
jgi:hypothetical protein